MLRKYIGITKGKNFEARMFYINIFGFYAFRVWIVKANKKHPVYFKPFWIYGKGVMNIEGK